MSAQNWLGGSFLRFERLESRLNTHPLKRQKNWTLGIALVAVLGAPAAFAQSFAVSNVSANENSGNLTFTVTATPAPAAAVQVNYATSNGTAVAGTDYTAAAGTLNFAAGVSSQTFSVAMTPDLTVEADEVLSATLSNPTGGASIGTATATGTLTNDDTAVISINAPAVNEGNVGNTALPFVLSLSNPIQGATSLTYTTADGNNANPQLNATLADNDYLASAASVSFASDSVQPINVNVSVVGDTEVEPNQSLLLNLSNLVLPAGISPAAVTFAASGVGTINNDDGTVLSINNAILLEGAAGSSTMTFTVSLTNPSKTPVTVQYVTANGTATAGSDYTADVGTLTFAPGVQSQTIAITIAGDAIVEGDETFTITLSAPTGASLGAAVGTGTISNDDSAVLSLNSVSLAEGNAGNTPLNFTATLSNPVQGGISATLNTADGNNANPLLNATVADNDYVAIVGAPLSMTGTTLQVPVLITGDTDVEPNQQFRLLSSNLVLPAGISPASVTLGAQGVGTINNDDSSTISVANASVIEGASGTVTLNFVVSLSAPNKDPVTVNFATSNGSAIAGVDYIASSGTVTFPSNSITQNIPVTVNGDVIFENDETINLNLSNPTGATIAQGFAVGTITDDDTLALSIGDANVIEGALGTTAQMVFTVTLTGSSSVPVSVNYASGNISAVAPSDYLPSSGTLNFAVGETSKTISVTVNGDNEVENVETFAMVLSGLLPANPRVTLVRATGTGTIGNDDEFRPVPALDWRGGSLLVLILVFAAAFGIRRSH